MKKTNIPLHLLNTRDASLADIPLIRELTFRIWPQTYASLPTAEQIDYMLEMMYSEESLARQMNEGIKFIIVTDETVPVGFAAYQEIRPSTWKLHKLYILPSQQGKGTGKYALEHIISEIKEEGATALQLQVKRDNKARFFYEKIGFIIIEELDLDIGRGYFMNDFIMEKKL